MIRISLFLTAFLLSLWTLCNHQNIPCLQILLFASYFLLLIFPLGRIILKWAKIEFQDRTQSIYFMVTSGFLVEGYLLFLISLTPLRFLITIQTFWITCVALGLTYWVLSFRKIEFKKRNVFDHEDGLLSYLPIVIVSGITFLHILFLTPLPEQHSSSFSFATDVIYRLIMVRRIIQTGGILENVLYAFQAPLAYHHFMDFVLSGIVMISGDKNGDLFLYTYLLQITLLTLLSFSTYSLMNTLKCPRLFSALLIMIVMFPIGNYATGLGFRHFWHIMNSDYAHLAGLIVSIFCIQLYLMNRKKKHPRQGTIFLLFSIVALSQVKFNFFLIIAPVLCLCVLCDILHWKNYRLIGVFSVAFLFFAPISYFLNVLCIPSRLPKTWKVSDILSYSFHIHLNYKPDLSRLPFGSLFSYMLNLTPPILSPIFEALNYFVYYTPLFVIPFFVWLMLVLARPKNNQPIDWILVSLISIIFVLLLSLHWNISFQLHNFLLWVPLIATALLLGRFPFSRKILVTLLLIWISLFSLQKMTFTSLFQETDPDLTKIEVWLNENVKGEKTFITCPSFGSDQVHLAATTNSKFYYVRWFDRNIVYSDEETLRRARVTDILCESRHFDVLDQQAVSAMLQEHTNANFLLITKRQKVNHYFLKPLFESGDLDIFQVAALEQPLSSLQDTSKTDVGGRNL